MRIIETEYGVEKEVNCIGCHTTLGYYPADILSDDVGICIFKYIKCPVCGNPVVISRIENTEERNP